MLNNNQSLFLNKTETFLNNNSNLFMRRGIIKNNVTNMLDTFSNILEIKCELLIEKISKNLQPIDFLLLNNGTLIDEFSNSNIEPDNELKF